MKKILALLGIILLVVVGGPIYSYYQSTYHGVVAYAKTPEAVPEKEKFVTSNGKTIDDMYTYHYTLTFVKEDGSTQKMDFSISGETVTPLPANTIVKAKISEKRVTEGPNAIENAQLPEKVAAVLK